VQLDGKQIRLAEDKREAEREFYRVMAAEGRLDTRQVELMTVADACEAMLAGVQHMRPGTVRIYTEKLGAFAAAFGPRRLDSIRPAEVIQWVAAYRGAKEGRTYGESTRALLFRYVKQLYRWCRDTGYIAIDPFVRVMSPWRIAKRDGPMTEEDYRKIMAMRRLSPRFKEIVEFIWRTGIRPGELAIVSARHLDARLPIARFQPTEHKTGTKTGLQREVYFPLDLWERLLRYAEIHRKGPLFRKDNGKPWTQKAISESYGKIKRRHGLTCVLYQARHRWATAMLESGIPQARVAKMAGHVRADVLMSTYYHPEAERMAADIDASREEEGERARRIAAEITEARAAAEAERVRRTREVDMLRQRRRRARLKAACEDPASDT
jgi:integrase